MAYKVHTITDGKCPTCGGVLEMYSLDRDCWEFEPTQDGGYLMTKWHGHCEVRAGFMPYFQIGMPDEFCCSKQGDCPVLLGFRAKPAKGADQDFGPITAWEFPFAEVSTGFDLLRAFLKVADLYAALHAVKSA